MNIEQMKYLVDISKTNSISNTARRLFISQQALSDSVRRLEKEFNCEILNRSRSGVTFTEAGKIILEAAKMITDIYTETEMQLQSITEGTMVQGSLDVGITPMANSVLLNDLMIRMHRRYPNVQMIVQERTYDTVMEELQQGNLDIAIKGGPPEEADAIERLQEQYPELQIELLYEDRLVCVMDKNNPLFLQNTMTMEQLTGRKCTVFLTDQNRSVPGGIHYSNNVALHQQMMQEEETIVFMPYQAFLAMFSQKRFAAKVITDVPPVPTYLAYRKDIPAEKTDRVKAFVEMVHAAISGIGGAEQSALE